MGMIRNLDEAGINQIAAGEVVERPSSVVNGTRGRRGTDVYMVNAGTRWIS